MRSRRTCSSLLAAAASGLLAAAAAAQGPVANPAHPTPTVDFSSVWNEAAPETTMELADGATELVGLMEKLAEQSKPLAAFESWSENGTRKFAGLFRPGSGDRKLFYNLTYADFAATGTAQYDLGFRLIDVEVRLVDGQRSYTGLWAPGSGAELWLNNLTATNFYSEWVNQSSSYHIVAFDTWWDGTQVRVFGVLAAGAEPANAQLSVAVPWTTFQDQAYDLSEDGYRLIDFDAAPVPDEDDYFSGRWIKAPHVRNWLGIYFLQEWTESSNHLFNTGYEFSAVNLDLVNFILPPPTADRMDLQDLEISTDYFSSTVIQGKPLMDSGTPGPPRPPGN